MTLDKTPETVAGEARALYWEMAIARKLRNSAITDKRFDDANYYLKQLRVAELRARALLDSLTNTTTGD